MSQAQKQFSPRLNLIRNHGLILALFASVTLQCGSTFSAAAEAGYLYSNGNFTQFTYPGATETRPFAINDHGDVVGWYTDSSRNTHGFIMTGSAFTSIDHPAAQSSFGTTITGINNSGTMVGRYWNGSTSHSFLYGNGSFTAFNYPGAVSTQPFKINNNGDIVGWYWNGSATRGFLYSGGAFTTLHIPGAISTQPYDINDNGQITGGVLTTDGHHSDGFLYNGGVFSFLSFPTSRYSSTYGINNNGEIVGTYDSHAFVYHDGSYSAINPPFSTFSAAHGINNLGQIVGYSILVPEPTSTLLFGLGLIGLAVMKSRG